MPNRPSEIRFTLIEDKKVEEQQVEETPIEEIEKQPSQSIKPPSPVSPLTNILVAEPLKTKSKQPNAKVVVNINSDEFKEFLKNETYSFQNENPRSLGEFDKTFELPKRDVTVISSKTHEARAQAGQTGVGMSIDRNGKRSCYALIPNIADTLGPQSAVSKGCTPPKKFILDLDKPRNN